MKNVRTTSLRFSDTAFERFQDLCDRFDVSQTELLESLIMQEDHEIQKAFDTNLRALRMVKRAEKDKLLESRRKIKDAVSKLTPEQIEALVNGNK